MHTVISVRTVDDLQKAIAAVIDDPSVTPQISDDLVLTIKINGQTWDGCIDYRVAKYVTELQRTVDRASRIAGGPSVKETKLVKVKIKEGSTDLQARAADLFEKLVANMTDEQKFIIGLVIIGCLFGAFALREVLKFLSERQRRVLDQKQAGLTVERMSENLRFALEKIDPDRAARTLVKELEQRDTIKLAADTAPVPREAAAERYPRKPRITPIEAMIDAEYEVDSVTLDHPALLTLRKGDHTFKGEFSAALGSDDRERFIANVKRALDTEATMRVELQIDARISDRVQHALIIGIGKPARPECKDLADLLR